MIITFKKFFKGNLKIFIAILITLLACWIADRHHDWNLDMMTKEVNTIFVVLVSFGILPYTLYKEQKKKDPKNDKKKE